LIHQNTFNKLRSAVAGQFGKPFALLSATIARFASREKPAIVTPPVFTPPEALTVPAPVIETLAIASPVTEIPASATPLVAAPVAEAPLVATPVVETSGH
jgi:hypothetical protein